jgi:hypothetical protein
MLSTAEPPGCPKKEMAKRNGRQFFFCTSPTRPELQIDAWWPLCKRMIVVSSVQTKSKSSGRKKAQEAQKGKDRHTMCFCAFLRQKYDFDLKMRATCLKVPSRFGLEPVSNS